MRLAHGVADSIAQKWFDPWADGWSHRKSVDDLANTIEMLLEHTNEAHLCRDDDEYTTETNGVKVRRWIECGIDCTEISLGVFHSYDQ